ncbi:hypothetical protein VTO42DRAFT_4996 [Malbranchea cinnamomea]
MSSHGVPRSATAANRSQETRQKELQKIEEYKNLVSHVLKKRREHDCSKEALDKVSELLVKNPEYYTIWNYRRQILQHMFSLAVHSDRVGRLIQEDLEFLFPLLKQFPKCYWIWNHRIWILEQATQRLTAANARRLWQQELVLVSKMLSLDSRNFHGWGYRRFVVAALESLSSEASGDEGDAPVAGKRDSIAKNELDYTAKMIGTNLSNFSAWHNRSQLILKILNERSASDEDRQKMLDDELRLIHRALIDPYDQSLWFYHQYLMCTFDPTRAAESMAPNLKDAQRIEYLTREIDAIKEILEEEGDCKWIYQALIECTMLVSKLDGPLSDGVKHDISSWLSQLKRLDPLRMGRWEDLQKSIST